MREKLALLSIWVVAPVPNAQVGPLLHVGRVLRDAPFFVLPSRHCILKVSPSGARLCKNGFHSISHHRQNDIEGMKMEKSLDDDGKLSVFYLT